MVTIYAIVSFLPQGEGCSFWPNMQGEGNMVTAELIVDASTIKISDYSDLTLLDGPKLSNIWQQQPQIKHWFSKGIFLLHLFGRHIFFINTVYVDSGTDFFCTS